MENYLKDKIFLSYPLFFSVGDQNLMIVPREGTFYYEL